MTHKHIFEGTAGSLRAGLLFLTALGVIGIAAELAYARHWEEWWQLSPWLALAAITTAITVLVARPSRPRVRFARIVAASTMLMAPIGVWRHFAENYQTAPLDGRYTYRWDSMSTFERMWEITNGSVGHVPVIIALSLVPVGLALGLATIGIDLSSASPQTTEPGEVSQTGAQQPAS